MKKFLILICTVIMLSGCDNKKNNVESFTNIMTKNKYKVYDVIKQYDKELVKSARIATKDNYQVEFLIFKSVDSAKNSFSVNRSYFKELKKKDDVETSLSNDKYSKYTLTTKDTFYLVSRIDATLIYITVDGSYKKDVLKVIKSLGY
ncbi:MAG: hypothetical protein RR659_02990 [Bacilli bacterium]